MCVVTTTTTVTMPGDRPPLDLAALGKALRRAQRAAGRKRCDHCGFGRHGADRGTLRRNLCASCELAWLDRVIRRLARRLGRKAAIATLKAIAK